MGALRGVGEGIPNFVVVDAGGKEQGMFFWSVGAGHVAPAFLGSRGWSPIGSPGRLRRENICNSLHLSSPDQLPTQTHLPSPSSTAPPATVQPHRPSPLRSKTTPCKCAPNLDPPYHLHTPCYPPLIPDTDHVGLRSRAGIFTRRPSRLANGGGVAVAAHVPSDDYQDMGGSCHATHPQTHQTDRPTALVCRWLSSSHAWTCDLFLFQLARRGCGVATVVVVVHLDVRCWWEVTNHLVQAGNGPPRRWTVTTYGVVTVTTSHHGASNRVSTGPSPYMLHTSPIPVRPPLPSAHLPNLASPNQALGLLSVRPDKAWPRPRRYLSVNEPARRGTIGNLTQQQTTKHAPLRSEI